MISGRLLFFCPSSATRPEFSTFTSSQNVFKWQAL